MLWDWIGQQLKVKVLFSVAGVSTQILACDLDESSCMLFDVGDGILRDILALPSNLYKKIDVIAISHFHYDHVGGIYSLLSVLRFIERTKELIIVTPPDNQPLKGMINTFIEYCGNFSPYKINIKETFNQAINIGDLMICPFVNHHCSSTISTKDEKRIPSVGYSVIKNGEKVVFTGDTAYFDGLKKIITNADLALIESTLETGYSNCHLNVEEAKNLGKNAKNFILVHSPTHLTFPNLKNK